MKPFYEVELENIQKRWEGDPRAEQFKQQYLQQGFTDEDMWDLDIYLAKLILPRLKRFKELASGKVFFDFPLDKMIEAFEIIANDNFDWWQLTEEDHLKIKNGLQAFAKYYSELWW